MHLWAASKHCACNDPKSSLGAAKIGKSIPGRWTRMRWQIAMQVKHFLNTETRPAAIFVCHIYPVKHCQQSPTSPSCDRFRQPVQNFFFAIHQTLHVHANRRVHPLTCPHIQIPHACFAGFNKHRHIKTRDMIFKKCYTCKPRFFPHPMTSCCNNEHAACPCTLPVVPQNLQAQHCSMRPATLSSYR